MRYLTPVALFASLVACRADRITTEDLPPVTFDAHAWRGGTLRLRSTAFATDGPWSVRIGGSTVPTETLDSVTLLATLPDTAAALEVAVESGGRAHRVGTLKLYGAVVVSRTMPSPDFTAMPWPYGAGTFLANVGGHMVRTDVVTGAQTPAFADSLFSSGCGWTAWPAGGNAVELPGPVSGTPAGWGHCRVRLVGANGVVADSFPEARSWWFVTARLPDGSWFNTGGNGSALDLRTRRPDGTYDWSYSWAMNNVWRLVASHDGRRFFGADAFSSDSALPILEVGKLGAPVALPFVPASRAAAFSPTCDTLAVQPRRNDTLYLVAAATGEKLAAVPAGRPLTDLAFDVGQPWLYAASADSGGTVLVVSIYDLRTMRVVATLRARSTAAALLYPSVYLSLDIWQRRLCALVVSDNGSGPSGPAVAFELLP